MACAAAGAALQETVRTPLCELLNIRYPVMAAGMAGVTGPRFVAAVRAMAWHCSQLVFKHEFGVCSSMQNVRETHALTQRGARRRATLVVSTPSAPSAYRQPACEYRSRPPIFLLLLAQVRACLSAWICCCQRRAHQLVFKNRVLDSPVIAT